MPVDWAAYARPMQVLHQLLVIALVSLSLVACSAPAAPESDAEFWSYFAPSVRERIVGERSCERLRVEFDTAELNARLERAGGATERAAASTGLMRYLVERIAESGCGP